LYHVTDFKTGIMQQICTHERHMEPSLCCNVQFQAAINPSSSSQEAATSQGHRLQGLQQFLIFSSEQLQIPVHVVMCYSHSAAPQSLVLGTEMLHSVWKNMLLCSFLCSRHNPCNSARFPALPGRSQNGRVSSISHGTHQQGFPHVPAQMAA